MQELDLNVQDSLVVLATFVDAVVTTAAQEELRPWSALSESQRRTDRCDRVVLCHDEQNRAADLGRLSHWPTGGDTEERASRNAVLPLRAVLRADDLNASEGGSVGDGAEFPWRRTSGDIARRASD
jgi:hypothetical protein